MQGFMQDKIIASHTCFGGHRERERERERER